MKRWIGWGSLMLFAYMVGLVVNLPAAWFWEQAQQQLREEIPPQLELTDISGTVWSGAVEDLSWQRTSVGRLEWDFSFAELLSGQLGYRLLLQPAEGHLQLNATINLEQQLLLSEAKGQMPASELGRYVPFLPVVLDGTWLVDQAEVILNPNGRPLTASGELRWQQAALKAPAEVALGSIQASVTTEESGIIRAEFDNREGDVGVKGSGEIQPSGRYSISGAISPRGRASASLRRTLSLLGRPDRSGKIRIQRSGKLF